MKNNILKLITFSVLLTGVMASCEKKLDIKPTNDLQPDDVFTKVAGYRGSFAKIYAAFALTGNSGPAGNGDVQGLDEGFSDFSRCLWKAQELSTDEAVIAWGDAGIQDFHNMNWSGDNQFLLPIYYRSFYQITLVNNFLNQSTDAKLAANGITNATDLENIKAYRQEARFIRAFQYWILMDLFGNPAFVDETTSEAVLAGTLPPQISRADLFEYIEDELMAIEPDLKAPRTNQYGRVDKAAVWSLLARIYLNAKVYTGTERNTDAITYSKKVIDEGGYALMDNYRNLMLSDNNIGNTEFILTINHDGLYTQSYGGTTFLTHASVGGSMPAIASGVNGGWGGIRATSALYDLFKAGFSSDQRGQFYTNGQSEEIKDQTKFTDGIAVNKFRNVKRDGSPGQSLEFSDVDFPLFRLAEQYLIYAEAVIRGGTGGSSATALEYLNKLRYRAFGGGYGPSNIGQLYNSDLNLETILQERSRELYWEGFRRTDLIRFDKFTSSTYVWPWKGGVKAGTGVEDYKNLYPIPTKEVVGNANIKQNAGYN
ncbi:RagB/SusD family nutrient uptake outer membrane protein [Ferruginibacter sp. SUN002]|uniref:RagB/SusD family nutrient uptake outer membrane protein n=1 Tax=Ferruginibacter sp. SUN002 TaxID=2937789 RepID=UPI003D360391